MVRARQCVPPVAAWAALALALVRARLTDGCPSREDLVPAATCMQRIECLNKSEGQFSLGFSPAVTRDCQWIVDGHEDFYLRATKPFNLTEQGGCSDLLQIAPAAALATGDMEVACSRSRLKSTSLFVAASRLALLPTQELIRRSQQHLRIGLSILTFRAGKAIDLCRQPVLVVNESTYVKTPYNSVGLPCSTMLMAESGRSLNISVVDAWPSSADAATAVAPGCVCYQLLSQPSGRSSCWRYADEPPIYDRLVNVTIGPAAALDSANELACTIVLRVDVVDLPMEQVTHAAETKDEVSTPGNLPTSWPLFIISTSVTVSGGIVLIGGLVVICFLCKRCRSSRQAKLRFTPQQRRLPPTPSEGAAQVDEPIYHELDMLTYSGHLTRGKLGPGIKESSPDANGSTTNDYEEIKPLNGS